MFALFDEVVILSKHLSGTIVDVRELRGETIFTVESNVKGRRDDGYGGEWPLFECRAAELADVRDEKPYACESNIFKKTYERVK